MKLTDNRKYSFIYNGFLNKSEYETYAEAVQKNKFFNNEKDSVYGKVEIDYNDKKVVLNIYSDTLVNAYGIEWDDKTGLIAVIGVSKETYNLTMQDNKISIFDSKLNFIRHVELKNIKNIFFDGKKFPVERIINVKKDEENDCMICELGFNYEWVAKFQYDMKSGEFKELLLIWRR